MSCNGCATKFTFFTKENSCPGCNFSYCSKCLKYKTAVPKLDGKECKVCKSCYDAITEKRNVPGSTRDEYCPPESFLNNINSSHSPLLPSVPSDVIQTSFIDSKGNGSFRKRIEEPVIRRLESLENPSRPPITLYRQDSRLQKLKAGLNETDREIADRLEKLKEERKKQPVPTEEEVARRLAMLKDEDPERMAALSTNKNYVAPDTRSSQEKASSLIQQYMEEKELRDREPDPAEQISQRLAKLRGLDSASTAAGERKILNVDTGNRMDDSEEYFDTMPVEDIDTLVAQLGKELKQNIPEPKSLKRMKLKHKIKKPEEHEGDEPVDEEEVERTVKKALEEASLEERLEEDELEVSENEEKEEELPWCIICNENATIRCIDCDNDLYCSICFKQGHDEWELKNHRSVSYTPKGRPS